MKTQLPVLAELIKNGGARQVFFAVTNRCDANCTFCGFRYSQRLSRKHVNISEAEKAIDYLANNFVRVISFTGGEPLLHPHLEQIISKASRIGILCRTGTNGISLNEKRLEALKKAGLAFIWLSIDSGIPEIHDNNRGKNGLFTFLKCEIMQKTLI